MVQQGQRHSGQILLKYLPVAVMKGEVVFLPYRLARMVALK